MKKIENENRDQDYQIVSENEIEIQTGPIINPRYNLKPTKIITRLLSNYNLISEQMPVINILNQTDNRIWYQNNGGTTIDYVHNRKASTVINYDSDGNVTLSNEKISGTNDVLVAETNTVYSVFNLEGSYMPNKPENVEITNSRPAESDTYIVSTTIEYNDNTGSISKKIDYSNTTEPITTNYLTYNDWGNAISMSIEAPNETDRITSTTFDLTGRFAETTTNSLGQVESYTYDPLWGNVLSHTSIDNLVSTFTYDGFGREETLTTPTNVTSTKSYGWNNSGSGLYEITNVTPGLASVTEIYDALGKNILTTQDDFGGTSTSITATYDIRGRKVSDSNPHRSSNDIILNNYEYDSYNRINRSYDPIVDITYSYSSDASGNLTKSTTRVESNGSKVSNSISDASGLVISETDAGNVNKQYKFYAHRQPKSVSVGSNEVMYMEYDVHAWQTLLDDKGGAGQMYYKYNGFGELDEQLDAKGNLTNVVYDVLGRPTSVEVIGESITNYSYVQGGSGLNQPLNISYAYSKGGVSYTNSESYEYDTFSRQNKKTENIQGQTFVHEFTFNDNNQIISEIYPNGPDVSYEYDANGFLNNVKSEDVVVFTPLSTNAYGQLTAFNHGSGANILSSTNAYDDYGYPTQFISGDFFDMSFNFDQSTGNLNWRSNNLIAGENGFSTLTETFTHDLEFDRLKTVNLNGVNTLNMTYDESNGNIKTKSDISEDEYIYAVDKIHQVEKITNTSVLPQTPQTIVYDANQQPVSIMEGNNELNIQYGINQQRRYSKLMNNSSTSYERFFVGDFERYIQEGTTYDVSYILGGVVAVRENGGAIQYYYNFTDHLGSVIAITDTNGNVVTEQSFDAWGRRRNVDTWTSSENQLDLLPWNARGFTSHEMLPEFNLINMNGRLYDNQIGRMLSPDEYAGLDGTSQGFNKYSYVYNNPLSYVDQSGECPYCPIEFLFNPDAFKNFAEGVRDLQKYGAAFSVGLDAISITAKPDNLYKIKTSLGRVFVTKDVLFQMGRSNINVQNAILKGKADTEYNVPIAVEYNKREVREDIYRGMKPMQDLMLAVVPIPIAQYYRAMQLVNAGKYSLRIAKTSTALIKTGTQFSKHALVRMAERGITPKMAQAAINNGVKFFDPKNGSINHILRNGFASGKDLLVATNPITGQVNTVIRGTKLIRPRFIQIRP